jgi:hypothetical protein
MSRPAPSPSVTQGKNYGGSPTGGFDVFRICLRIRAMLRAFGPMTTQRLRAHLMEFPEQLVGIALQFLLEEGEIARPIQSQKWRLAR